MKPFKIDDLHGLDISLQRITPTIEDADGTRNGDDEIILCVPEASKYDTDFIQEDCAILHFSPRQAIVLARRLMKLATRNNNPNFGSKTNSK